MEVLKNLIKALIQEEAGQDLIDYALLAGVLGLGIGAALNGLSQDARNLLFGMGTSLTNNVS